MSENATSPLPDHLKIYHLQRITEQQQVEIRMLREKLTVLRGIAQRLIVEIDRIDLPETSAEVEAREG